MPGNLHAFDILRRIKQFYYWSKSNSYWTVSFLMSKYTFRIYFVIWYDLFSDYLVEYEYVFSPSQKSKYVIL